MKGSERIGKPINRVAVAFWVIAVIFLFADVPMMLAIREWGREVSHSQGAPMGNFVTFSNAWYETRSALLGAGQLAGIGTIIELLDRIRWTLLSKEERLQRKASRLFWHVRNWPHAEETDSEL